MKKNDFIELFTTLHTTRVEAIEALAKRIEVEQSNDEKKELQALVTKHRTHARYIARIIDNATLCDAVASQCAQLKLSADQIKEIEQDAYSLRKFAELMISFAQKRKVNDEHSFSEALAVLASGVVSADAVSFGKKMTTRDGKSYGARQAQMTLKLLERLNACTTARDGRTVVFTMNTDSAVYKRIMSAYEN